MLRVNGSVKGAKSQVQATVEVPRGCPVGKRTPGDIYACSSPMCRHLSSSLSQPRGHDPEIMNPWIFCLAIMGQFPISRWLPAFQARSRLKLYAYVPRCIAVPTNQRHRPCSVTTSRPCGSLEYLQNDSYSVERTAAFSIRHHRAKELEYF